MSRPPSSLPSPRTLGIAGAALLVASGLAVTAFQGGTHVDGTASPSAAGPRASAGFTPSPGLAAEDTDGGRMGASSLYSTQPPPSDPAADATAPAEVAVAAHSPAAGGAAAPAVASPPPRPAEPGGETFMTLLPTSVVEVARTTVWSGAATESLDRLILIAFDANGDLTLDDLERIAAVQAMRDVMWPTAAEDAAALVRDVMDGRRSDRTSDALLQPEDLRLHHDVDESRRLDHAAKEREGAAADPQDAPPGERDLGGAAQRDEVIQRFQLDDDDKLAASEFARFMRFYRVGAQHADLNRDGRADEADLRAFLDVARPIRSRATGGQGDDQSSEPQKGAAR